MLGMTATDFAQRFFALAQFRLLDAGLDHEASAEDHPRHDEYLAIVRLAWKDAAAEMRPS
jgi:hypothetical protein